MSLLRYIALFFGMFLLNGCRQYLAVSGSGDSLGGVYRICGDKAEQVLVHPFLNAAVHDPVSGLFYATAGRLPDSQEKHGGVAVFRKTLTGRMELLQTVSAKGQTPCHLALSPDRRFLYTANYSSGDISEFRIKEGKLLSPPRLIRHSGHGLTRRQKAPHPHFTGFDPAGKQLFVCDLGTDQVWIYNWEPKLGVILPFAEKLQLAPGSGPRHLVFSPDGCTIFTANELNSSVTAFHRQGLSGDWQNVKTLSTLSGNSAGVRNAPGAIKITADGKIFFVTNRGDNSIALFSTGAKGDFKLQKTFPSRGNFPNDLIFLEDKNVLSVIHLKSGNTAEFQLDRKQMQLVPRPESCPVPRGMGLCMAEKQHFFPFRYFFTVE